MMNKVLTYAKKLKVLYIEDNEDARESTLGLLNNIFTNIVTAINGEDGLEKFKSDSFDLVLTDINMPKMNGLDMISHIRKINSEIPIIVISAYNESGYFIETIKLGVEGYLLKPINFKQFLNMIQKSLERIQLKDELREYHNNLELKIQQQTQALSQQLYYDTLTGLPNRNSLLKFIKDYNPCCLILIDIKNFSVINDLYGSKIGDNILINISKILLNIAEKKYKVFRIAGDHFSFTAVDSNNLLLIDDVVKNISVDIENKIICTQNDNIKINISITASVSSGTNRFNLLKNAEIALHYAKETNQSLIYYSNKLNLDDHFKKKLDAVIMVKNALKENRVIPFFQKIEKYEQNATYECLVRIKEDNKIISPISFLNAIKKTTYYIELTKTMINKSFERFQGTEINFSINLSYEDISNSNLIEFLEKKIKTTALAKQLILEIVESENIDNFELVKNFIQKMQNLGVRIAIDDFGSGYSNFSHILELNPDIIKVDGSLVKRICEDEKSFIVVKTIVNFAQELGIETIVEFVHNQKVFNKIEQLNISGIQGYYISKPKEKV
ncbi:MAG: REC domain-containing phosphodiesterase [Epsilonproteobacteria bacterium]|nr:MAG: REC domain-containing phosphodiesterase [Campylobacterota bacterium]